MKKSLKYILAAIITFTIYYLLSIYIHNSGQFINYYFYPSSSIIESKEKEIFIENVSKENIKVNGIEELRQNIDGLVFWFDKSKTRKIYGMISVFSYSIVNQNERTLRVSYKNPKMRFSSNHKTLEWISFDNGEIESLTTTFGKVYHINDMSIIHFYDKNQKEIGTVSINIK